MPSDDDDVVVAGHVGAPYGVRGWVKVVSYTDPYDGLLDYRPWLMEGDREPGPTWAAVAVADARRHRNALIAHFAGVDDRDAAERLGGKRIGFARAALPEAGPDEYYWRDLIGLAVHDQHGRSLGIVDHLIATGAHDVIVIGSGAAEVLIPFHAQFVRAVRLDDGVIDVTWDD